MPQLYGKKFEYEIARVYGDNADQLNELGREGWVLAQVHPNGTLILVRELVEQSVDQASFPEQIIDPVSPSDTQPIPEKALQFEIQMDRTATHLYAASPIIDLQFDFNQHDLAFQLIQTLAARVADLEQQIAVLTAPRRGGAR